MGFVDLKQHISRQAKKEKKRILDQARNRAEEIRGEYDSELQEVWVKTLKEGEKRAHLAEKEILGQARVESKIRESQVKSQIIKDLFSEARKEIQRLPDEKISAYLSFLIDKAELPDQKKTVIVCPEYADLVSHKKSVNLVEKDLGDLGLVVEGEDGRVSLDFTLGNILDDIRQKKTPEVSEILFT